MFRWGRCAAVGVFEVACYAPLQAWRAADGAVVFVERGDILYTMSVPCGRCIGCRLDYAQSWEVRLMHEAQCHDNNCFITLTYSEDRVSRDGSLVYPDFQAFMRRLRKYYRPGKVRFFVAGEYGGDLGRPHFHVALFGVDFRHDRKYWRKTEAGFKVDRSATLERLWPLGHSEIGELTPQSANYIARYIVKKVTGDAADVHYRTVDTDTGELTWRVPEFCHMSLKPGIGAKWFARYCSDVFPHDRVVSRGVKKKVPRYYDKLFKKLKPDVLEQLKEERLIRARTRFEDNTPERLFVREQVEKARLRSFKRGLK